MMRFSILTSLAMLSASASYAGQPSSFFQERLSKVACVQSVSPEYQMSLDSEADDTFTGNYVAFPYSGMNPKVCAEEIMVTLLNVSIRSLSGIGPMGNGGSITVAPISPARLSLPLTDAPDSLALRLYNLLGNGAFDREPTASPARGGQYSMKDGESSLMCEAFQVGTPSRAVYRCVFSSDVFPESDDPESVSAKLFKILLDKLSTGVEGVSESRTGIMLAGKVFSLDCRSTPAEVSASGKAVYQCSVAAK